jgi:2-polyprenyl-6-methoxyphenol hydroxylase-like FAD-dependent oxidoreductase
MSADSVFREVSSSGIKWDPALLALIKRTPGESVVDWRLLWRDPAPKWVSDCGRVVQIGDAAHSFLPTSANGGTQACEDAISLAACLSLGGKHGISLATRVHNTLR